MKKIENIGKISILEDTICWKITNFSEWLEINNHVLMCSPLFRFAGGDRYFFAQTRLEKGSVVLYGMSITYCSRDRHDFCCFQFGIMEKSGEKSFLLISSDAHGGLYCHSEFKNEISQNLKSDGNLNFFCHSFPRESTAAAIIADKIFDILQLKYKHSAYKEVATQKDMESDVLQLKDKHSAYKEVATQKDTESDIGNLCQNFKNLLLNGQDHDLVLKVKDKEVRAHQCILRVRSPVLDSMLSHDMIEKKSGVIDIPDCDPGAFEQFLLYLYSGELETLDECNMLALYYISDKYDMGHLKTQCREFIKNSLTTTNVSDVIQLALDHSDAVLLEYATEYFLKNVSVVLRTVEWQSFATRNAIQANELCIKAIDSLKAEKI